MERPKSASKNPDPVAHAGAQLERFAEGLSDHELAALRGLLIQAAARTPLTELAMTPPEAVLAARDLIVYEKLRTETSAAIGGRSILTVIIKATRLCNLRCTYCHSWKEGPGQVMGFPVLARTIRDAVCDASVRYVDFVWHGGEVTLLPPEYYRRALWLQEQFRRPGQIIKNTIQTNGTRFTDEWLAFICDYGIGVGVSLDGPPEIHDRRRLDVAGRPTAARVHEGLKRLRSAGITQVGVLMVVDEDVCNSAALLLDYLLEVGLDRVSLLNVIPPNTIEVPKRGQYLPVSRFVRFLEELFHLWWPKYHSRLRIRELDDLITKLTGGPPNLCVFAGGCFGGYLTVEPTGEVSACDKYIGDHAYSFGNVLSMTLAEIQTSRQMSALQAENAAAVDRMRACPWFAVCQGGCPHDRYTGKRLFSGFYERCCGFSSLLSEMANTLSSSEVAINGLSSPLVQTVASFSEKNPAVGKTISLRQEEDHER
jgi:uncharacterized protein